MVFKDHWINAVSLQKRSKNAEDCLTNTSKKTGEGNRPIPPAQQTRQRREQQFEGLDDDKYTVDPRTGWRFYPSSRPTPSSSSTHWEQHDDWKSNKSWDSWRTSSWSEPRHAQESPEETNAVLFWKGGTKTISTEVLCLKKGWNEETIIANDKIALEGPLLHCDERGNMSDLDQRDNFKKRCKRDMPNTVPRAYSNYWVRKHANSSTATSPNWDPTSSSKATKIYSKRLDSSGWTYYVPATLHSSPSPSILVATELQLVVNVDLGLSIMVNSFFFKRSRWNMSLDGHWISLQSTGRGNKYTLRAHVFLSRIFVQIISSRSDFRHMRGSSTTCSSAHFVLPQKSSHLIAQCHSLHLTWALHRHLARALLPWHDLPHFPRILFSVSFNFAPIYVNLSVVPLAEPSIPHRSSTWWQRKNTSPPEFQGRIISMSMFQRHRVVDEAERMTERGRCRKCCSKCRTWSFEFLGPRDEETLFGTTNDKPNGKIMTSHSKMTNHFQSSGHPVFQCYYPPERSQLKSRRGKETLHFNADWSSPEFLTRKILAVRFWAIALAITLFNFFLLSPFFDYFLQSLFLQSTLCSHLFFFRLLFGITQFAITSSTTFSVTSSILFKIIFTVFLQSLCSIPCIILVQPCAVNASR